MELDENGTVEGTYGSISRGDSPVVDTLPTLQHVYKTIGFGKAQVFYWTALSFVAYSDTAELMLISIILPYLQCEWDLTIYFETLLIGAVFFFDAIGGIIFGKLSDIYGRRKVLTFTVAVICLFSCLSAMTNNKWQFLFLRCFVGLCTGAAYPTTVSYSVEVVEDKYREFGPTVISSVTNATFFFVAAVAYVSLNSLGWRWYIFMITIPSFIAFVALRLVPESPRYLSASGDSQGATEAVVRMAKWNNVKLHHDFQLEAYEDQTLGSIKDVLSEQYRWEVILLGIMYFGNMVILFELIMFLPLALNKGFCGGDDKVSFHTCQKISQESLGKLVLITISSLIAIVTVIGMLRFTGRKIPARIFAGGTFVITLTLYVCWSKPVTILKFFLITFGTGGLHLIIWIITSEYFPTVIRSTASGFVNTCGKLGGVVGSAGVYFLFYTSPYLVVSMFVLAAGISLVATLVWDKETKRQSIQDVILDEPGTRSTVTSVG